MLDEERPVAELTHATGKQLSLFELFFVVTLVAVALGVYVHISSLLALLAGGAWIVVAVVRWSGMHNLVLGGLVGFCASGVVDWLIVVLGKTDTTTSIGLWLLCPAAGYIVGAFIAELREAF
jgi:hypothetical protein